MDMIKREIKTEIRSPQHENGHRGRSRSRSRSRSPNRRSRPVQNRRLYISNMPFDMKWKDVKDLFKEQVGDCYVTLYERPDGKSLGAGLVEFRDLSKAQEAVDKMNRYEVSGRKIIVREETDRDRRRHENDKPDGRGGGGGGGRSGGGGDRGGDMRGGHPMDRGGGMNLPMNLPPGVTPQLLGSLGINDGPITNQVFVANLDYRCSEQKLKEVFSMAGSVTKLECKNDKDGKFRGMAVIAFETPMEALQAISMFNGQTLFDRNMSVKMDKLANMEDKKPSLPEGLKGIGSSLPLGGGGGGGGMGGPPGGFMGMGGGGGMGSGGMGNMGGGGGGSNMGSLGGMSGGMSGGMGGLGGGGGGGMGGMGSGGGGMGAMSAMSASGGDYGSPLGGLGGLSGGGGLGGSGGSMGGLGGASSGSAFGGMDNMGGSGLDNLNLKGIGDLSSFASLAANLQNNPEAFNTLSNMMNNISGGASMGGGGGGGGMPGGMGMGGGGGGGVMNSRSYGGGRDDRMDRGGGMGGGMDRGRRSPMRDTGEITSVFVRNLPFTYTWQMMKETFKAAGEVQYAEIKKDSDNKSRGFGIVRFSTPDEARRAVNLFNKTRVNGRELEVRLNNVR